MSLRPSEEKPAKDNKPVIYTLIGIGIVMTGLIVVLIMVIFKPFSATGITTTSTIPSLTTSSTLTIQTTTQTSSTLNTQPAPAISTTTTSTTSTSSTTASTTSTSTTLGAVCRTNLDCGMPYQEKVCQLGDLYMQTVKPTCINPGTAEAKCSKTTTLLGGSVRAQALPIEKCRNGCVNATCF